MIEIKKPFELTCANGRRGITSDLNEPRHDHKVYVILSLVTVR